MADSQQVTSQTPTTKTKNPKRVAAGKAIAEKTRLAREAQKKALDEANAIIANKKAPEATPEAAPETTPEATPEATPQAAAAAITTTQWLSGISIFLSIVGIYYKREEIKALFAKKKAASSRADSSRADSSRADSSRADSSRADSSRADSSRRKN